MRFLSICLAASLIGSALVSSAEGRAKIPTRPPLHRLRAISVDHQRSKAIFGSGPNHEQDIFAESDDIDDDDTDDQVESKLLSSSAEGRVKVNTRPPLHRVQDESNNNNDEEESKLLSRSAEGRVKIPTRPPLHRLQDESNNIDAGESKLLSSSAEGRVKIHTRPPLHRLQDESNNIDAGESKLLSSSAEGRVKIHTRPPLHRLRAFRVDHQRSKAIFGSNPNERQDVFAESDDYDDDKEESNGSKGKGNGYGTVDNKPIWSELGRFAAPLAGFLNLAKNDLLISTFGVTTAVDPVLIVRNIGQKTDSFESIVPSTLTNSVVYPNDIHAAPKKAIAGNPNIVAVAGGFFFKANGAITLVDTATNAAFPITASKGIFYHKAEWYDVDGDGLLDIVTAGIFGLGPPSGALYWLKQPATNPLGQKWTQTKVIDGPDVYFSIDDIDGDGDDDLLVSHFLKAKISIYTNLTWTNPSAGFHEIVVDNTIGPVFRAEAVDLHGRGKKSIIATNHVADSTAGLFAYEFENADEYTISLDGPITKHVIRQGYVTRNKGRGQASPGGATAFKPSRGSKRPYLLVSGDGNQAAYLYTPIGKTGNAYNEHLVHSGNPDLNQQNDDTYTIGAVVAGDVDGDGNAEFFIPVFEKGFVYGYTINNHKLKDD